MKSAAPTWSWRSWRTSRETPMRSGRTSSWPTSSSRGSACRGTWSAPGAWPPTGARRCPTEKEEPVMADEYDYDVVVIGSGFGGAVTAYRLAASNYSVLVLERGHRWGPNKGKRDEVNERGDYRDDEVVNFPRTAKDAWFWDHKHPEQSHGWLDFRNFPYMGVVLGSGVGGGSLIYANVSIEADERAFDKGWPAEITLKELKPYYDKVTAMLELAKVPPQQWSERVKLMREGAKNNGWEQRFQPVDVAVRFDGDLRYESSQRPDPKWSRRGQNKSDAWQGTCA